MDLTTKVGIIMDRNMAMERFSGLMVVDIKVISIRIIFKVKEHMSGKTIDSSQGNGLTIKCMASEFSRGRMAEFSKVIMSWIKKKAMESSYGQMEKNIKENGKMEISMVSEQ